MNLDWVLLNVLLIPIVYPHLPLNTPISGTNTRRILEDLVCFSMLFQEHMLKFSACYEFVPGYYLIALGYKLARCCWWHNMSITRSYSQCVTPLKANVSSWGLALCVHLYASSWGCVLQYFVWTVDVNTGQLVPMSTRTHVNSYPCQLVPMSTRTTNICQLVPQVMSTRTTIRCQLVPN